MGFALLFPPASVRVPPDPTWVVRKFELPITSVPAIRGGTYSMQVGGKVGMQPGSPCPGSVCSMNTSLSSPRRMELRTSVVALVPPEAMRYTPRDPEPVAIAVTLRSQPPLAMIARALSPLIVTRESVTTAPPSSQIPMPVPLTSARRTTSGSVGLPPMRIPASPALRTRMPSTRAPAPCIETAPMGPVAVTSTLRTWVPFALAMRQGNPTVSDSNDESTSELFAPSSSKHPPYALTETSEIETRPRALMP